VELYLHSPICHYGMHSDLLVLKCGCKPCNKFPVHGQSAEIKIWAPTCSTWKFKIRDLWLIKTKYSCKNCKLYSERIITAAYVTFLRQMQNKLGTPFLQSFVVGPLSYGFWVCSEFWRYMLTPSAG